MASPPDSRSISRITCCGLISLVETSGVQRMLGLPLANLPPPGCARGGVLARGSAARSFLQNLVQLFQHALHVAHDGQIGRAILADFRRIDIHVNHFGMRREGRQAPGDAVVEAHAQRDQQIGMRSCPCSPRSCRACPAC